MQKPVDLFDRDAEWNELSRFATSSSRGIRLALVRGRRRQGKSYLLRRLCTATDGLYYQALEENHTQALARFGRTVAQELNIPGGSIQFSDWEDACEMLFSLRQQEKPWVIVLDEFPYLLEHSPELPSLLQMFIDKSRDGGPDIKLIICGSALSVMAKLLSGTKALYGRANLDIRINAFDYRDSAQHWGIDSVDVAFVLNAIIGGTPGYKELLDLEPPKNSDGIYSWLSAGVLNPGNAMFYEDDYLLTEEKTLTDRTLYHSVVTVIAQGNSSQGAIAAALGKEQRAIQHPLTALEEAGFVTKTDDILRARRPIYSLVDPIIRFHHVITRHDLPLYQDKQTLRAWEGARERFRRYVLGPHYEKIARDYVFSHMDWEILGQPVSKVGQAVINDSQKKSQHQLDIVALGSYDEGNIPIAAIGEVKYTSRALAASDLERLDYIKQILSSRGYAMEDTKLLFFSAAGFTHDMHSISQQRGDIVLCDTDSLYSRSLS